MRMRSRNIAAVAFASLVLAACGGEDGPPAGSTGGSGNSGGGPDVGAGSTVMVAVVNPVVNDAHNTPVPASLGTETEGIVVDAEPGEQATTKDGLAVVDVPTGNIELDVDGAKLTHLVEADGDVYDAAIALDGSGAAFFDLTPIRYAVGKDAGAFYFDVDDSLADIEARLAEDDRVVVLGPGTYKGDLTITGKGVTLFGEGFSQRAVVIEGSITANGEEVRLRGLTITGSLAAKGNNFGISFSVVEGTTSITGNSGAFLRNVFCGQVTVPSSNALLLDNEGIEPLPAPLALCP